MPIGATVANHVFIRFKAHHRMEPITDTVKQANNLWLYVMSLSGESTIIILLSEHSNKMSPNDLLLYPYIGALKPH